MRTHLPIVTKVVLVLVTVLSLGCELYRIWGEVKRVAQVAEGEDGKQPLPNVEPYLVILILRKTPWWAFWTLVTTGFVERQFMPYLLFVIVAATAGRHCEKVWGARTYLQFAMIMLVCPAFIETLVWGCIASSPRAIHGANGLLAGIVVALKQLVPGHTIILFRNSLRVQIKWLPLIFLVGVSVLQALGAEDNVFAYYLGTVVGWIVLRFHHTIDGTVVGDASDAFSFSHFFPQPLAGWLEVPLDNLYVLFSKKLRLVRSFSSEEIDEANQRYAARLSGTLLPSFTKEIRTTNERRMMMLRSMDRDS